MSRQIKEDNNMRLVFSGPSVRPTELKVEYRVIDGDLAEPARVVKFSETDFDLTVGDLWIATVNSVKKSEGL